MVKNRIFKLLLFTTLVLALFSLIIHKWSHAQYGWRYNYYDSWLNADLNTSNRWFLGDYQEHVFSTPEGAYKSMWEDWYIKGRVKCIEGNIYTNVLDTASMEVFEYRKVQIY